MNDRHHSNHDPLEPQEKADQVVSSLESESSTNPDDFQRLGEAVRQSSNGDLPESCEDLRELLSATVDDTVPTTAPKKPVSAPAKGSRRWMLWATTTAALLAVGAFLYSGPKFGVDLLGGIALKSPLEPPAELNDQNGTSQDLKTKFALAAEASSETAKGFVENESRRQLQKSGEANPPLAPNSESQFRQTNSPQDQDKTALGVNLAFESKSVQDFGSTVDNKPASPSNSPVAEQYGLLQSANLPQTSDEMRYYKKVRSRVAPSGTRDVVLGELSGGAGGGGFGENGEGFRREFGREGGRSNEQYDAIHENPFLATQGAGALSTFSIDVDTASYANMRRFLTQGHRVPANAVRIEEFINYFDYDYPQPEGDTPFSVNMELASCPWNDKHQLLRIGLKGKEVHRDERPAANIVFLIDVSGSMNSHDKLPLLKSGFQLMVNALNENDRVSIVTYSGDSKVVLEPTSGDQKQKINNAISNLKSGGSTNGGAGIETAYQLAQRDFIQEGTNKVILASDGDLNVGITSDSDLVKLIKNKASEGVFLSVLGFGTGNLKDSKMEKLADNGNGDYSYIDGVREAHKVLVEGMSGSLVTIAKDVKLQLEFNPAEVKSYRLIGYENRILAARDFDDDTKDAGEIGAGHTVTALYELVPTTTAADSTEVPQGLKYQQPVEAPEKPVELSEAAKSGELLTLALRYKQPDSNESERIDFTVPSESKSFSTASGEFKFAASVAAFGMLLRGSEHRGNATPQWIQQTASESIGKDASGYRAEFIDLVRRFSSVQ